jgi:hypothetical protein
MSPGPNLKKSRRVVYFLINTCLTGLRSWKSSGGKYPCASSLA